MDVFQAIILAIIEGLTEFLPISSTGHMAIASAFMGINTNPLAKLFMIVIQFGAILSVVVLYWKKFLDFKAISFYIKLVIAILPALVFGALLNDYIDAVLEKPLIIAIVLLAGGIILIFVDKWFVNPSIENESKISNKNAFIVGLFQVLAIVLPGLSRSAATIIGGMQQKMTRQVAAEFSFFLAVPTMLAATIKSLYDMYVESPEVLSMDNINIILIGSLVAFIIAILAIKFLITYLQKNGFRVFGWYRIILGILLLTLIFTGYIKG
jgi:undecaprenyl-diphosphatase